jgi:hypothetical protein
MPVTYHKPDFGQTSAQVTDLLPRSNPECDRSQVSTQVRKATMMYLRAEALLWFISRPRWAAQIVATPEGHSRRPKGGVVLYTQCAFCSSIGPLMCAGTLMPHMPVATVRTPYGAVCPGCGSVMTGFLCPHCMTQQYLLLPGASAPAMPGANQAYAPVVQAKQGASKSKLMRLFEEIAIPVAKEIGKAGAQAAFGQQPSWQGSTWQQSSWGQW